MAPQRQRDVRYETTRIVAACVFMALTVGGVLYGALSQGSNVLAFLAFYAGGVVAFFVAWWPLPYRCPRCRRRLPFLEDQRPIHVYYCASCEIEWETGRRDGDDD